jgi:hypothetical protein
MPQAAPVSWALTQQARQGITSCTQDDGIGDYPTDFSADSSSGCRWSKFISIPAWISARLTGFRAFVQTNG